MRDDKKNRCRQLIEINEESRNLQSRMTALLALAAVDEDTDFVEEFGENLVKACRRCNAIMAAVIDAGTARYQSRRNERC